MSLSRTWTQQIGCILKSLPTVEGRVSRNSHRSTWCIYRRPVAVKASVAVCPVTSLSSFPKPFPLSSDSVFPYSESQTQSSSGEQFLEQWLSGKENLFTSIAAFEMLGEPLNDVDTRYLLGWIYPNRRCILGMKQ